MEDILIHIPDKIVVDDIKNYLDKKTDKHLFSDIYNGKTSLSPNYLIKYYSNKDIINLYEGGLGMGNYISIAYSIKENIYIYYTINTNENPVENYKSDNWFEFQSYVRKELLDIFIRFNSYS